ncbi:hypothetical protein C8R43DRAFT_975222 [Mycena crocata]|nr:hypothetical protein C8R43DRAFT_975222 [Mycena crocata]
MSRRSKPALSRRQKWRTRAWATYLKGTRTMTYIPTNLLQASKMAAEPPDYEPPDLLFGNGHCYDDEAFFLRAMKGLREHARRHCANADKRRFSTQTTTFLRDVVQYLPENPMQILASRANIRMNLLRNFPLTNDDIFALVHGLPLPTIQRPAHAQPLPCNPCMADPFSGPPGMESTAPVPRMSTPRGQKRAHEDDWGDSPRMRGSPSLTPNTSAGTPDARLSGTPGPPSARLPGTPGMQQWRTPDAQFTSTPDARNVNATALNAPAVNSNPTNHGTLNTTNPSSFNTPNYAAPNAGHVGTPAFHPGSGHLGARYARFPAPQGLPETPSPRGAAAGRGSVPLPTPYGSPFSPNMGPSSFTSGSGSYLPTSNTPSGSTSTTTPGTHNPTLPITPQLNLHTPNHVTPSPSGSTRGDLNIRFDTSNLGAWFAGFPTIPSGPPETPSPRSSTANAGASAINTRAGTNSAASGHPSPIPPHTPSASSSLGSGSGSPLPVSITPSGSSFASASPHTRHSVPTGNTSLPNTRPRASPTTPHATPGTAYLRTTYRGRHVASPNARG